MAGSKKKARSSKTDDDWAPSTSSRHRLSMYIQKMQDTFFPLHPQTTGCEHIMTHSLSGIHSQCKHSKAPVQKREQRQRRAPTTFTPTTGSTPRRAPRKQKDPSPSGDSDTAAPPSRPEHKRMESRIRAQAHRLRYPMAFIEAYEAQGWRNTSQDKLKPNKEIEAANRKILAGQRSLLDRLRELQALNANDPQVPPLAKFEEVHCSRCGKTEIEPGNDILLCDSIGCHRAYHQQCQNPIVLTESIPAGDDPWFCEVCLSVFECLKAINTVFGTTYESVDDLFPQLALEEQQAATDASSPSQSADGDAEDGSATVDDEDEEEDDEDFVFNDDEEEDADEDSSDERAQGEASDEEEELAEEVPESADDLKYLQKDDVIDLNQRSMRSKASVRPQTTAPKKAKQEGLVGERVAKIDRKTKELILGVIAEFHPPAPGKYSRWRADYHDGTSELLTGQKVNAAMARAAHMGDNESADDADGDGNTSLVVRGKRKRTEVDYRQLNELMFAGKGEDSEEDETFEVKEESDDDDGNGEEEEDGVEEDQDEGSEEERDEEKVGGDVSDQSSPTAVSATQENASQPAKRSRCERANVDYLSMHEGILDDS